MGTKNRTREDVGDDGLVGVEFWCFLVLSFGGGVLALGGFWAVLVLVLGDFYWWGEKICGDWAKL